MARKNLIISFLGGPPASIKDALKDETIFVDCPVRQQPVPGYPGGRTGYQLWLSKYMDGERNVIPRIASAYGLGPEDEVGKVCVFGFSNGCIGVDEVLRANDAQRIDVVLAVDGIHGSFDYRGLPAAAQYKNYMNQAAHVAQFNAESDRNAPIMVVSHSSIDPGAFPSTTATADIIWNAAYPTFPPDYIPVQIGWGSVPWLHMESIRARYADIVSYKGSRDCSPFAEATPWYGIEDGWYDKRGANNFYVLGWGIPGVGKYKTKDPTGCADHIFQGQTVLKALLDEFVVQRWNARCGQIAGLGGPQACVPPSGVNYATAAAQKVDYFPDLTDETPVPSPCSFPPPGRTIVGSPTDPCALDEPYNLPGRTPESQVAAGKWLAAAAGFAAGYGLAWYGGKLCRDR
jgi:hypothetical protein